FRKYSLNKFITICFLCRTTSNDISCLNDHKYVQQGEIISLNCKFSAVHASVAAWFKQTPGENPLLIVSAFHTLQEKYHNGFNKSGRFNAVREKNNFIFSFNLKISNAESSDSATYYCIVAYHSYVALFHCTVFVLKGNLYTVLQPPVSDPVQLGGNTTLQCSILTDNSAGDHSVYWFRHGSGESDPGIIFTHGNRSDQCKKSSETVSPTQSCIYKLPKNNLSLSDAGTYYCAVAACGHIFFGNGTKLDLIRAQTSFSAGDFRCGAEHRRASARDILGAERRRASSWEI
uniref:Ig-like domain-containing protein n=1 Tax=Astyanax mexicanus TaxID=7994 RepID=A0A3B1J4U9_ASTMX